MKTKCHKLKKSFKTYANSASIHGIPDVFNANTRSAKVFWSVILIVSFIWLSYEICSIVSTYLKEPTVVSLEVVSYRKFPEIYYCPENWIDENKMRSHPGTVPVSAIEQLLEGIYPFRLFLKSDISVGDLSMNKSKYAKPSDSDHVPDVFNGASANDVLRSFARNITIECGTQDCSLEKIVTTYGMCYRILVRNPESSPQMVMDNLDRRIYVRFISETEEMNPDSKNQSKQNSSEGMTPMKKILPIKKINRNFLLLGSESLIRPSNALTLFGLKKYMISYQATKMERVSTRSNPCKTQSTFTDVGICFMKCINAKVCSIAGTKCEFLTYNASSRFVDYCNYFPSINEHCIWSFLSNSAVYEECDKYCIRPCIVIGYQVTRSINVEQPDWDLVFMPLNDYSVLEIKEQKLYTWSTLLGSIGGVVSLFCGASILSFVQIVSICCFDNKPYGQYTQSESKTRQSVNRSSQSEPISNNGHTMDDRKEPSAF